MSDGWRVAMAAVSLFVLAASAAASDAEGPGIDVLILVDRSRSMSAGSTTYADDALTMTAMILAWSAQVAHVRHRLGIISFGSAPRIDVPFTIADRQSLPALQRQIGALSRRSLGHTNFPAAFAAAAEALDALPLDARRRRAILLFTDGRPSVPGWSRTASTENARRTIAARLSAASISIEVLLLGSARDAAPWQQMANVRVHRVPSDRGTSLAILHRIVGHAVGTRNEQQGIAGASDVLVIPPYLDLVIFDVFRGSAGKEVSILAPGATQTLDAQSAGVEEIHIGDLLTTLIIRRPAPGQWTFRKADASARVKVLSQQFFPRGVLVTPAPELLLRQHDRVSLQYRVIDGEGRALRELPEYPLSVDVTIAAPDGRRTELTMQREGDGVYRAAVDAECEIAGRYWTEIVVTTPDAAARRVRVFEDRWSGFTVEAAARVDCRLAPLPDVQHVRVQCVDRERKPTELVQFLRTSPLWAVVKQDGKRVVSNIPLAYLGRGMFEGVLPPDTKPGAYALHLAVDPARVPAALNIRIDPAHVIFLQRTEHRMQSALWIAASVFAAVLMLFLSFRRRHVRRR
jgi:uncharacterized protein YegL